MAAGIPSSLSATGSNEVSFWVGAHYRQIAAGEDCDYWWSATNYGTPYVIMTKADYDSVRGGFSGFNLADVAAIVPAVALVWAVAWLFKRLLAVLRNQI